MKKNLARILSVCLLLPFCVVAPVAFTGCSSPTHQSAAVYLTFKDVQIAVDNAMQLYGAAVVTGKISAAQTVHIDDAHEQYRAAFGLAVLLASNDYSAITPAEVTRLANDLIQLINQR